MNVDTAAWLIKALLVFCAFGLFSKDRMVEAITMFGLALFMAGFQAGIPDVKTWAEALALSSDDLIKGWFCGSIFAGGVAFAMLWCAPDVLKIQQHLERK